MKYCPKCGASAQDNDSFCAKCGEKLPPSFARFGQQPPQQAQQPQQTKKAGFKFDFNVLAFVLGIAGVIVGMFGLSGAYICYLIGIIISAVAMTVARICGRKETTWANRLGTIFASIGIAQGVIGLLLFWLPTWLN